MTSDDPIVEEVRRAGEDYFKQFNYDLHAICEDLRQRSRDAGEKTISLPPRRVASPDRLEKKAG